MKYNKANNQFHEKPVTDEYGAKSVFFNTFSFLFNLLILNLLTLLCSLPIISAGAALTAMYAVINDLNNGAEKVHPRTFFSYFRMAFKQSLSYWAGYIAVSIMLLIERNMIHDNRLLFPLPVRLLFYSSVFLLFTFCQFVFPLLAQNIQKEKASSNTLFLSFSLAGTHIAKAILSAAFWLIPVWICFNMYALIPAIILFGSVIPAYLQLKISDSFLNE